MDDIALEIQAPFHRIGSVRLDEDEKLVFPSTDDVPGVYCFTVNAANLETSVYVGETQRLKQRFQQYRTPGPTQRTNIRLNELFRSVLASGGSIEIAVISEAAASGLPLDLERKPDRLVVENACLVLWARAGMTTENA